MARLKGILLRAVHLFAGRTHLPIIGVGRIAALAAESENRNAFSLINRPLSDAFAFHWGAQLRQQTPYPPITIVNTDTIQPQRVK